LEKFLTVAEEAENILYKINNNITSEFKEWLAKGAPICFINKIIGIVHGDLTEANILRKDRKAVYIIDWQRPMKAPILLENAFAFRRAGLNAIKRYGEIGRMALVCDIIWYTLAYKKWIPVDYIKDFAINLLNEFNEGK